MGECEEKMHWITYLASNHWAILELRWSWNWVSMVKKLKMELDKKLPVFRNGRGSFVELIVEPRVKSFGLER